MVDHDKVKPFSQPIPTNTFEEAAIKYKPELFVSYGCHPYPAVQANGSVSAGLEGSGPVDGECKGSPLGSQVYSRSAWYNDKWAIMYTWYLPKGRNGKLQNRHFWETAVVWIDDPTLDNSTLLGVSLNYEDRLVKKVPVNGQYLNESSVKLESYEAAKSPKPSLRFTEKAGKTQDLIAWEQLTGKARKALITTKFYSSPLESVTKEMPLKDEVFLKRLKDAWPFQNKN
ncbi:hypothetical protein V7S43_010683 [Phytophthora oleae]|uniref:Necrosis inducing protein NPP1 n=1 Tax=Phytophthora oleae TaxID=2107226 RepID=A0ABD3FFQ5_9STRA